MMVDLNRLHKDFSTYTRLAEANLTHNLMTALFNDRHFIMDALFNDSTI